MTPAELNRYWLVYTAAPERLGIRDAHAAAVADFLARRRAAGGTGAT